MKQQIEVGVEKVAPELAEEWLGKNVHNRNIRERLVAAYARDMAAGAWRLSGEAVKFSRTGALLDGQHRLHAVVRAAVPVEMLIVRGLDPLTQQVMDSGATRTADDALRLRGGSSYYPVLAATARLCVRATAGLGMDTGGGFKVTNSEVLGYIDATPDLLPAVEMASTHRNHIDVPLSVLAYAVWRLSAVDTNACNLFITKLADKTLMTKGDPILALHNRLTEIRRNGRHASRTDYVSLIFRAWNHWRTGKSVQSLPLSTAAGQVDVPEPR